jgi:hypothetical protein
MPSFFGKYRGVVTNNLDPMGLGRVMVMVPAVSGEGKQAWAMPSVPYAGTGVGMVVLPPVGAHVWVEYEGGDADFPIWTGCFWNAPQEMVKGVLPGVGVLQTRGIRLVLNDTPEAGGLTIEVGPPVVATPCRIVIDNQGIELAGPTSVIRLTPAMLDLLHAAAHIQLSAATVSVNNGALEVT